MYTRKAAWITAATLLFGFLDITTTYISSFQYGGSEINTIAAAIMAWFGAETAILVIFPCLKVFAILFPLALVAIIEKKWPEQQFCLQLAYCTCWFALVVNMSVVTFNTTVFYGGELWY